MRKLTRIEAMDFVSQRRQLFDAHENAFSHSAWLLHFLDQVAEDDWKIQLAEHALEDGSAAVMLLYEAPGVPCQSLSNYYCSLYTPVVAAPAVAPQGAAAVVQALSAKGRPSTVRLSPMAAEDADRMAEAFRQSGWYVKRFFCFGNWYLPCEGLRYDTFLAGRDSKLRHTLARKSKKYFAEAGNRLEIISDPAQVERGMDAYDAVFRRSWKKPEPYPDFIRGWARICARHGWLRLGIAWCGDVPVAVQFWFVRDGRAHIFKLAYDEAFSRLSAGTILTAHMFRHALDVDRVIEIDYLTGDDAYKKDWMSQRRERFGLLACDTRSLRGLVRALIEAAGSLRRKLLDLSAAGRATAGSRSA